MTTYTVRSAGGTVLSEYRAVCGAPVWSRDVIYAGGRLLGSIKATSSQPTVALTQSASTVAETTATITATLALTTPGGGPLACPLTVSYEAIGGTAASGANFRLPSGSVTFNAGDATGATRALTIEIVNDTLDEPNETFSVTLASAVGAQVGTAAHVVTITDEDPRPSLSIGDTSQYEGQSGITSAVFTVTLSAASGRTVQVAYASSNGTALAGTDYQAVSASVSLLPGLTTATISVPIFGDGAFEPNETFQVTLSAPSNATLSDAQALGTLLNDARFGRRDRRHNHGDDRVNDFRRRATSLSTDCQL